jgi:hypothetical protein
VNPLSFIRRRTANSPIFLATQRFDRSDAARWIDYIEWAKIPGLTEVVSVDTLLCPHLIREFMDEDWNHIVNEHYRLDYFEDLSYLLKRVANMPRRNILGLYRNTEKAIIKPPAKNFTFIGHDLIEEATQISALTNCGGFPEVFSNEELNQYGLLTRFDRAYEVRKMLATKHPQEPHAQCEMYAVWRLIENRAK